MHVQGLHSSNRHFEPAPESVGSAPLVHVGQLSQGDDFAAVVSMIEEDVERRMCREVEGE